MKKDANIEIILIYIVIIILKQNGHIPAVWKASLHVWKQLLKWPTCFFPYGKDTQPCCSFNSKCIAREQTNHKTSNHLFPESLCMIEQSKCCVLVSRNFLIKLSNNSSHETHFWSVPHFLWILQCLLRIQKNVSVVFGGKRCAECLGSECFRKQHYIAAASHKNGSSSLKSAFKTLKKEISFSVANGISKNGKYINKYLRIK